MPASPEPAAASPVAAPVDPVKSEDTKDTAKETATPAVAAADSPAPAAEAPATPAPTTPAPSQPAPAADTEEKKDEKKEDVKEDKKDEPAAEEPLPDSPDGIINMEIFSQIQDMDDEDDEDGPGSREFSKGIVWGYFEQAEATFKQMEEAIAEASLSNLSSLGHFLKGSSAALGIIKVQNSCEKMQHYGNLRDEEVGENLEEGEALERIKQLLVDCKRDYGVASRYLRRLYNDEE
ncbi:transferase [Trichosporon asahii var. asahii CBS 8904]|uniref:Transferase n=1 Tax=Trichosporon asahii var. asahii (strain CBS 8904) TaxID=1220162 RepID=K1VSM4_TRIAC|nr:transferase [Trichosporon asahii var. asahii CBS 8904]